MMPKRSSGLILMFAAILCPVLVSCIASSVYSADSIHVAAIYALTGEASEANASSILGVRIGVMEINAGGGILGKRVDLKVIDNQSTPIGSYMAALKAAKSDAVAIIGAAWSSHSLPMAEVAQSQGIPMISSFSTNPAVTRTGDYIFRVCFTDEFQGAALARFARNDLKAATAGVFINLNSEYSIGLSQIFRRDFERLGGKVIYEADYKHNQESFEEQIAIAKKTQADIMFLSGYDESGWIAKLAQDSGVRSIPVGGDGWADPSFLTKGGEELEQAYYCSHWSQSVDRERSRQFVKRYNGSPDFSTGTALAYDAVMVLADAIRRSGSPDRAKLRDALAQTRSFEGVTGALSFNEQGDPIKSVVIMGIRKGKPFYLKTLSP